MSADPRITNELRDLTSAIFLRTNSSPSQINCFFLDKEKMALSLDGNSVNIGNSDYLLDPVHPVYFLILLGENYLSFNRNGEASI